MKGFKTGLLVLAVMLTLAAGAMSAGTGAAQGAESSPLIVLREGDFWQWNAVRFAMDPITQWGFNGRPALSPDGQRFAYNSAAQVYVDAMQAGTGGMAGAPPSNIWVWETATGQATRIADQPPGATLQPQNDTQAAFFVRSDPVWSPDGGRLAWREVAAFATQYQSRLVVYDLVSGQTTVLSNDVPLGFQDGGLVVPSISWGQAGIATHVITYMEGQDSSDGPITRLLVYSADSGALILDANLGSRFIATTLWVQGGDGLQYLAVQYSDSGQWDLFEPVLGLVVGMSGMPELYSTLAPEGVSVLVGSTPTADRGIQYRFYMMDPDGFTAHELPHNLPDHAYAPPGWHMAIAPSGQQVAYLDDAVYLMSHGALETVSGMEPLDTASPLGNAGIAWGPTAWRIRPLSQIPDTITGGTRVPVRSAERVQCSALTPSRLRIGGPVKGLDFRGGNDLHLQPDAASAVIGMLPTGDTAIVLGGPVCAADDTAWWQVLYDGVIGWTPETHDEAYWLEPVE